ncbi:hypothetical protein DU508_04240 [Pedobacter chinensis]|uniref:Uncharacterized protein n=1 Tax=Pedobacter chinensis TaxID=2282421 RepID=A0A369PZP9_9SPHI|nr:FUSC family membrane protein [Pedobacter chinensis]RDC58161.1 hypothetical protein DU508_04240 [Pedobacter chinensis]
MINRGKKAIALNVTYFFLGEYFSDALRTTLTILFPIVVFFYFGNQEAATGIGVGALLISLTDLPDNRLNKLKTAIISIIVFFFTTLLVSQVLDYPVLSAVMITSLAFALSLLAVYGQKMGLIGTMALIVCAFVMGLHPERPLYFSGYMLVGGIWYYVVSLIQTLIRPYRSLNHAIFECLIASAAFLKAKAKNYDPSIPFDHQQKDIIKLHIRVNQKHELIRNLLLTDRYAMNPDNKKGQILLKRAGLLIDLYEQLNAVHFDYEFVRKSLANGPGLQLIANLIRFLAEEIEDLGKHVRSIQDSDPEFTSHSKYSNDRGLLLSEMTYLSTDQSEFIRNIVANIDDIASIILSIRKNEWPGKQSLKNREEISYPLFVSSDRFSLKDHLSLKSPIFRFSLRMAICFLFGFILIWQLAPSKYSYWLFLTLVIVARPKFSITWKRNFQRLKGSLGGVIIGLFLIFFIKSPVVLLSIAAICLLGFYAFNRINYTIGVLFITPAVILTLGSYHGHFDHIVHDRILFTIIGCGIAILATYIFPIRDSKQLGGKIREATNSSLNYFLIAIAKPSKHDENKARMARKNANLSLSDLSESIESASQEPWQSNINLKSLYELQVIIYKINAMITSIYLATDIAENREDDFLIKSIVTNLQLKNQTGFLSVEDDLIKYKSLKNQSYNLFQQKLKDINALSFDLTKQYDSLR